MQDRLFDIDKIRRTNEEEIRLREVRERSFERRSVYPRPTPYAARPVVPAGPTQEDLDAEYIRICQSYDPTSDEWTVDRYNRRWIMCTVCGRIKQDAQMSYYGGKEVQTGESVPIVHEMVVANPHIWLDIIRMMVYY